jgi:CRP/FNR family transcriptional regulator, nitrogen oxide reductase regulator
VTAGFHPESAAVAALEIFEGISASALYDVMAAVRVRALPRGSRVFDQGEPTERAHALLEGAVRISQAGSDGEQVVIRFIGPGEIFGAVAIYTDRRYPADAVTMADSLEASWSQSELYALLEKHPRIGINMIGIVGRRLAELQDRVRELATQRVERRVAHTLLRLLRQFGQPAKAGTTLSLPLRRKDIADITGTRLHSVSRVLAGWERAGLLVSSNLRLTVCSVTDIERIAES